MPNNLPPISQLHLLINFQFDAAKVAPNTKRHSFAGNKLECIESKSSFFIIVQNFEKTNTFFGSFDELKMHLIS